jgi:ABC-2 type transport system ATP-binding protein
MTANIQQEKPKGKKPDFSAYPVYTSKLRKEFDGVTAVAGLDLRIGKGVLYGMIGPNGSGKTTAIKVLMGLLRAKSGRARLLGERVPLKKNRRRIGYMPQELAIYSDLTIHENLELYAGLFSMDPETFQKREKELLTMIDLRDRKDSLVSHLSGGMKHRASLACALVHDPELVFLDEPTVGVDPELRAGFWKYFNELKSGGKTIVLTTHYMDEAQKCDIVGMMRLGELIAEGTPQSLMEGAGTSNLEDAFLEYARRGSK